MKNKLLIGTFAMCLAYIGPVMAQMDHGAFLSLNVGGTYDDNATLQSDLRSRPNVGSNIKVSGISPEYGGSLDILYHSGLVIRGTGFGYGLKSSSGDVPVEAKTGAGIIDIGYVSKKSEKHLAFPYFGLGGFGSKFSVNNTTADKKIFIDTSFAINPGQTSTFLTGGVIFEAGYSYKYFAFNPGGKANHHYGTVIGVDAGVQYTVAMGYWRDTDYKALVERFAKPSIFAPYIRLTIGFGAFSKMQRDR